MYHLLLHHDGRGGEFTGYVHAGLDTAAPERLRTINDGRVPLVPRYFLLMAAASRHYGVSMRCTTALLLQMMSGVGVWHSRGVLEDGIAKAEVPDYWHQTESVDAVDPINDRHHPTVNRICAVWAMLRQGRLSRLRQNRFRGSRCWPGMMEGCRKHIRPTQLIDNACWQKKALNLT